MRHIARPRFQDPVPPELAAHAAGENTLSKPRLQHYIGRFGDNLPRLAIAVLDDLIDTTLTDADPHTGLVVDSIRDNRRALVRYLRTTPARSTDFAHTHPNNRRWLDTRTTLDTGAWLGTLSAGYRLKDGTKVTLEQESDPHQILRMGSLVGSCLGIGGMYAHSLVPNLLDANKRVIFARNTDTGAFIARQLIAVTDDEKLACFDVYPVTAPDEIVRLFRLYDESLALDLGIPRLDPKQYDYDIATLTCREWYDDGTMAAT